jgi:hypothetical protein
MVVPWNLILTISLWQLVIIYCIQSCSSVCVTYHKYSCKLLDLKSSQRCLWRMSPSGICRRMFLVGTDVSAEHIASIFRVKIFNGQKQVNSSQCAAVDCYCWRVSVLWLFLHWRWRRCPLRNVGSYKNRRRKIPEDDILQSYAFLQLFSTFCSYGRNRVHKLWINNVNFTTMQKYDSLCCVIILLEKTSWPPVQIVTYKGTNCHRFLRI